MFNKCKRGVRSNLRSSTSGAALVEYVILLVTITGVVIFTIPTLSGRIVTIYEDVAEIVTGPDRPEDGGNDPSQVTGPKSPIGPEQDASIGPAGPDIRYTGWGRLIDGQPCPDTPWKYDPYNEFYHLPGVAVPMPVFYYLAGPGGHVTAYSNDEWTRIPKGDEDGWNWWGEYYGITLLFWDTYEWTAEVYGKDLVNPPHPSCPNITYPGPGDMDKGTKYQPYYTEGQDHFLMGTPGADTLDLRNGGPWKGVVADGWDDTIYDTSGSEIIIPGPGNEYFRSAGGWDTFVWTTGDGNDQYMPQNPGGQTGNDMVALPGIAYSDASISLVSLNDIVISIPSGETLKIAAQTADQDTRWLQTIAFKDRIIKPQSIFDDRVASLKKTGMVTGSNRPENYVHTASIDGSYTIEESRSDRNGDILTFTETYLGDVMFTQSGSNGSDLVMTLPDGDRITIKDYFFLDTNKVDLVFADGTSPSAEDVEKMTRAYEKKNGNVYTTYQDDYLYHTAALDGSYTISGPGAGTDVLEFTDTTFAQSNFLIRDNGLRITLAGGDVIFLKDYGFPGSDMIDTFVFQDGTFSAAQVFDRAASDAKPTGRVEGTYRGDNYRHIMSSDGSYTIGGEIAGTDTLTFSDVSSTAVRFSVAGTDLIIALPDGDRITLEKAAQTYGDVVNTAVFTDAALTEQQMHDRAMHDMKTSGTVVTTTRSDKHVHTSATDGSYTITGSESGTDSMSVPDVDFADTKFYVKGLDLHMVLPDGDKVILVKQAHNRQLIENWTFRDGARTNQQVLDKAAEDAKVTGTVEYSGGNDNFYHTASKDAGYTVSGSGNGTNSIYFTDVSFENARFATTNDVAITTPDGDTVLLVSANRYSWYMSNFYFNGVKKTITDIRNRAASGG